MKPNNHKDIKTTPQRDKSQIQLERDTKQQQRDWKQQLLSPEPMTRQPPGD